MKKLLWLDDVRDPFEQISEEGGSWLVFSPLEKPFETIWVKTYDEFVDYITLNGLPDGICFDHDLGKDIALANIKSGMSKREAKKIRRNSTKTGKDCANWLVDYCIDNNQELPLYNIQSANPIGKENIDGLLKNYLKYCNNLNK